MPGREPDPRAARNRVGMRSSLAGQVRQKEQALTPCGDSRRFFEQLFEARLRGQTVAIPLKAPGCAEHHAHEMPAVWQGVTESMKPPFRLDQRGLGSGKNDA